MVSQMQRLANKRCKEANPGLFPEPEPTPPTDPNKKKKNKFKRNKCAKAWQDSIDNDYSIDFMFVDTFVLSTTWAQLEELSEQKRRHSQQSRNCYNCGEMGHSLANCQSTSSGWAEININPWELLLEDLNDGNKRRVIKMFGNAYRTGERRHKKVTDNLTWQANAQKIGREASNFIQNDLKMDFVYNYMFHLLSEYSKLLRYKSTIPQNAIELCSEIVLAPKKEG
ncbi:hypothetical protein BUALT_Bualt09G0070000 [Buddleja alternifolia]|uniref:CCHC-type domain-containing protein n=1 Tax=Buddleja alternifolia TaxID=168488 RepID=A0AAV6X7X2_9LAMI|nr:hypothetical protein BUALT_Bualt09G0070000 [Buddleja alternifolia]